MERATLRARRPARIHPLPDWFNLFSYEFIASLTNRDLIHEIIFRVKGVDGVSRRFQAQYVEHESPQVGRLHDGSVPDNLIEGINYACDLMLYRQGEFTGAPILADLSRGHGESNKAYEPIKPKAGEVDCLIKLHSYTDKEILPKVSPICCQFYASGKAYQNQLKAKLAIIGFPPSSASSSTQ